jgi:hypothetical protein
VGQGPDRELQRGVAYFCPHVRSQRHFLRSGSPAYFTGQSETTCAARLDRQSISHSKLDFIHLATPASKVMLIVTVIFLQGWGKLPASQKGSFLGQKESPIYREFFYLPVDEIGGGPFRLCGHTFK